jgi:hypothetical protein
MARSNESRATGLPAELAILYPEPFSLPVAVGGLGIWLVVMGCVIAFAEEPQ